MAKDLYDCLRQSDIYPCLTDFPKTLWNNQGEGIFLPFQRWATCLFLEGYFISTGSESSSLRISHFGRAVTAAHFGTCPALSLMSEEHVSPLPLQRVGGVWQPCCPRFYPLITAIGLSLMAFLLIPASWQVFTTSVTFL